MAVKIAGKLGPEWAHAISGGKAQAEQTEYEVSFEGAVLDVVEENGYDDSDFYAIVWDGARIRRTQYATTRGWTYANSATVDATEAVKAAAEVWLADHYLGMLKSREASAAELPSRGKRVKVVKGRKVAIDTEGEVFWMGEDRYARRYSNFGPIGKLGRRVGVKLDSGEKVFLAAENVDVIDPDSYQKSDAELREQAVRWAKARNWRSLDPRAELNFLLAAA